MEEIKKLFLEFLKKHFKTNNIELVLKKDVLDFYIFNITIEINAYIEKINLKFDLMFNEFIFISYQHYYFEQDGYIVICDFTDKDLELIKQIEYITSEVIIDA